MTTYAVPALEKGLDLLEALAAQPEPRSQTDLARALGRSPSEIFRMLACLERRGYIVKEEASGRYRLTLRLYELAHTHTPVDQLLHAAVLAYASDYALLEPVIRRHGLAWSDPRLRPASLDHAMWFHRAARADEWILYTQSSPTAQGGRGLAFGRMFAADGRLVASAAQEGMIRIKE